MVPAKARELIFVLSAVVTVVVEGFVAPVPTHYRRAPSLACSSARGGALAPRTVGGGLRMTVSPTDTEWQAAIDPASGAQYWYNPTTSETSWDAPTPASPAAPAAEGVAGVAGSKQQQLALLLANNEARAAAREQKQAQEKAERAAKAIADRAERSARQAQASLSSSSVLTKNSVLNEPGVKPKNAILAMNAAKAAAKVKGGQEDDAGPGLLAALNPLKPGVIWYKEPSLVLFFSAKIGVVLFALFVGFHNPYTGDFGPFIAVHDGQIDFGGAAQEWARLHTNQYAAVARK